MCLGVDTSSWEKRGQRHPQKDGSLCSALSEWPFGTFSSTQHVVFYSPPPTHTHTSYHPRLPVTMFSVGPQGLEFKSEVFWWHSKFFSLTPPRSCHFLLTPKLCSPFYNNPLSPICVPSILWNVRASIGACWPTRTPMIEENYHFPQNHPIRASSVKAGSSSTPSPYALECWGLWSCGGVKGQP